MNRKRNLSSLIKEYQEEDLISTIERGYKNEASIMLPLEKMTLNEISKEHIFNEKRLQTLISSIQESGVLNPILVRKKDEKYEVCSGYRRYYVAKKLNLKEVPVVIRDISDDLLIYLVLSRSSQKSHDNILNKTNVYQTLVNDYGVSRKDIATISKVSLSQVNNIMRLNNLSNEVKNVLKKDKISYGQARVLVNLEIEKQIEYLNLILTKNLSVHDIENLVKRERRPSFYLRKLESFEEENNVKISIGRKNLTLNFKKRSDLRKFIANYLKIKSN